MLVFYVVIIAGVLIWVNSLRIQIRDENLLRNINDNFHDL